MADVSEDQLRLQAIHPLLGQLDNQRIFPRRGVLA